jgi:manganese oxidase
MKYQPCSVVAIAVATAVVTMTTLAAAYHPGTRHYYIAAEDVVWDFAPSGQDLIHGAPIPAPFAGNTVWSKTRYVEYTDGSFSVRKPQPVWLGILGPMIRAVVGDTVIVHFRNNSARGPLSMHPHGFRYDKNNEGVHYEPASAGAQIPPGGSFDYVWIADRDSGPGSKDPSSIVWWYHSHNEEADETNAGLLGPIIVTAPNRARADATPHDVEQEFVTAWFIFDEAKGEERGLMHAVNGRIFGNLEGLVMRNRARVRWYTLGMGSERDLHTPHWHGKTLLYDRRRTNVLNLLPGTMVTADMRADNPGTWLLHCHVFDHIHGGMQVKYEITP